MLLGRTSELEYLRQFYVKEESQMLIVYGQKGIGKTTLLLDFAQNFPHFYYQARTCCESKQKKLWARELDRKEEELKTYGQLLAESCLQTDDKKIIIVDEFQQIAKTDVSFMKECVSFLEESKQEVLLILASSSIVWVENAMIARIGNAAYSISAFLKLKELSFETIRSMFPQYSSGQCLEIYSICGGIPELLTHIDDTKEVAENLCTLFLEKDAVLKQTGEQIITEELRETGVYNTILESLASGRNKLNELFLETGFSRAKISVYLKNLMELEFVEKVFSYDTQGRENTKKGIYQISNHFVHFWFRFLFPNLSCLPQMSGMDFYNTYIKPYLLQFKALYFKDICLEYLLHKQEDGSFPILIVKCGAWVGKAGTIDIVLEGEDGSIATAFCKFERTITTYEDYEWNLFCLKQAQIGAKYLYLFSANGFDEKIRLEAKRQENLQLIDFSAM